MRKTRRYFRRKKRKTRRRRKRRKRTRRRRQRRGRGTPQTPSKRKRPESTPSRRPPSVYYDARTGQRPQAGRFKAVRPLAGRFKPVRPRAGRFEPIPPSTKVAFCEKCNQPTSIPLSNRFFVCKECGHRQNTPLTASEIIKRYPFDNSTPSKILPGQRYAGNEIHMHLLAPGKKTKGEKRAKVKAAVKRTGAKTKGVFKAVGEFLRTKPKERKSTRVRLSEVRNMPEVGTHNDEGGVFLG